MTVYLLCFVLFLVGLYGVITRRNLIKIAISLSIMEFSIFLILVAWPPSSIQDQAHRYMWIPFPRPWYLRPL